MPIRTEQHHATGGGRAAWEHGFGSVRVMGMQGNRFQPQRAPGTGLPPGAWAGVRTGLTGATGNVVSAVRQSQQRQRQQASRSRSFIGQQPQAQQPQIATTPARNPGTWALNPDFAVGTAPTWGSSFDNGTAPGVTSVSDINSRMAAFSTPRPAPPNPPVAVRGLPIRPPSATA